MNSDSIVIHTDGACSGNPGPGGFAAILEHPDLGPLTIAGGHPATTNNRMELTAVIESLKAVNSHRGSRERKIIVRSDSKYLTDAFNQGWLEKWRQNGWRTSKGNVLNRDLWTELLEQTDGRRIDWMHIRGHNGDPMNERCDRLAVAQSQKAKFQAGPWLSVGEDPGSHAPTERTEPPGQEELVSYLKQAIRDIRDGDREAAAEQLRMALAAIQP